MGDWGTHQPPIPVTTNPNPNSQSPIPNPQSPIPYTRRVGRTAIDTAAAFALLAASLAAAPRDDAFAVGVLRRDGIVVPFAAFDGRRWSRPWPGAQRVGELTVPISLSAVPKSWWGPTPPRDTWHAFLPDGTRTLRVTQPDWVDVHCGQQVALRTDYTSSRPAAPPEAKPYPKDGLATSPPHAVEPIEIFAPDAIEARSLLPVMHTEFNEAERRVEQEYGHPIVRRAREGVLPTIEALYAYGDGPRVYYVEAIRPYRRLGQALDQCAAVASGTGWFVRDAAGIRALTMAVDLLTCRRDAASYMLPLGVLRIDDRVYWLAQFSGWDHERYVVLELKRKSVDVVVNSWAGGC